MAAATIDEYLDALVPEARDALERLRATILDVCPNAEECISYGVPGFKVDGEVIAGFAAAKAHLSYFPHSGSVLSELDEAELAGYSTSKGTLRFTVDTPLSRRLVERLITARLRLLA